MTGHNSTAPTVLVIDDERLIRWSIGECLEALGYRVKLAASGAEARAAVDDCAERALIVILDLHLPDVDDLGLLLDIHARCPNAPVIIMTTSQGDEARCRVAAPAVAAFLRKPFDLSLLASYVHEVWRAGRA